jgi:hypothetical protein
MVHPNVGLRPPIRGISCLVSVVLCFSRILCDVTPPRLERELNKISRSRAGLALRFPTEILISDPQALLKPHQREHAQGTSFTYATTGCDRTPIKRRFVFRDFGTSASESILTPVSRILDLRFSPRPDLRSCAIPSIDDCDHVMISRIGIMNVSQL